MGRAIGGRNRLGLHVQFGPPFLLPKMEKGEGEGREGKGGPALTSVAGKARGRVEVVGDGVGVRRPKADGG